jgi:predicted nucleic acid-binding Zn ribbon protein
MAMSRSIINTGTRRQAVTHRDRMSLPLLVRATPEQIKRRDYDGLMNFDPKKPLQPVRIFGADAKGSVRNKAVRQSMTEVWPLFIAVTQLRAARESGNKYEIDQAFRKLLAAQLGDDPALRERIAEFWATTPRVPDAALVNLPPALSQEMSAARLVLWWNKRRKQFLPAIFCPDYRAALFVQVAMKDLRACPDCDKPFIPDRPDQEYCSVRCRERHRQRRRRDKLRKEQ